MAGTFRDEPEEKKDDDLRTNVKGDGRGASRSEKATAAAAKTRAKNYEAMAHLARYETMVRHQEAEDMATLAYMKPCLERLHQLGGGSAGTSRQQQNQQQPSPPPGPPPGSEATMDRTVTFGCLRVACETLGEIERDAQRQKLEKEFLATDKQLLMVLRVLTKDLQDDATESNRRDLDAAITWAEFVQCYKACISGMLTLQQLTEPPVPTGRRIDGAAISSLRSRTRDRTVSMMNLFGTTSTRVLTVENDLKSRKVSPGSGPSTLTSRAGWLLLVAGGAAAVVVGTAAILGRSDASLRHVNKPPRFVPLTALYPPNFFNTSPPTDKSSLVAAAATPTPSFQDPFTTNIHPQSPSPVGVLLATRAATVTNKVTRRHRRSPLDTAFAVAPANDPRQLSVWHHAVGGAVVLPLATQFLFPPAAAGRFVATASLLTVAAVGAATNVLSAWLARLLGWIRVGRIRSRARTKTGTSGTLPCRNP
jgi:hypothetical protein